MDFRRVGWVAVAAFAAWLYFSRSPRPSPTEVPAARPLALSKAVVAPNGLNRPQEIQSLADVQGRHWRISFPRSDGEGNVVIDLRPNPKARARSFAELMGALRASRGHLRPYVLDEYDCKHFAAALYAELQAQGFAARFAAIAWTGKEIGHAVVAVETTDQGRVFVDFTPAGQGAESRPQKALVWVEEGDPSWRLDLDRLPYGFEFRRDTFERFDRGAKELEGNAQSLEAGAQRIEVERAALAEDAEAFSSEASSGQMTREDFEARRQALLAAQTELNEEIEAHNRQVEGARRESARIGPVLYGDEPVSERTLLPPE